MPSSRRARRRNGDRRLPRRAGRASALDRVVAGLVSPTGSARVASAPERSGFDGEGSESIPVDDGFERRRCCDRRKPLGAPGEAEAAVPARLGALLAEVRDERVDLAAVVRDERERPARRVRSRPARAARTARRAGRELVAGAGRREQRCSAGRASAALQLDEALLARGSSSAATIRLRSSPELDGRGVGVECSSTCGRASRSRRDGAGSRRAAASKRRERPPRASSSPSGRSR